METSMFLTQAFGLFYVIGALALLMHKNFMRDLAQSILVKREMIIFGGFLTLIVGIPLVLVHNVWEGEPYVIIVTISCWLTFLKGVIRVWFPDFVSQMGTQLVAQATAIRAVSFIMLLVGVYLCYVGFGM
ncbi:MAG: hypothetical protein R3B69_01185 [Candidatus Paceibacterota bacterium]